jgi:hypothetical protein
MLKARKRDGFTYESSVLREKVGGVAERLIAPVLKTGRPKGLVSSNLTPSASKFRLAIGDFRLVADKNA